MNGPLSLEVFDSVLALPTDINNFLAHGLTRTSKPRENEKGFRLGSGEMKNQKEINR